MVKVQTVYTPNFGIRFLSRSGVKCKKTGHVQTSEFLGLTHKENLCESLELNAVTKKNAESVPMLTKEKTNPNGTSKNKINSPGQFCKQSAENQEQHFLAPCPPGDVTGNKYTKNVVWDQKMFMKIVGLAFSQGRRCRPNGDVFNFLFCSKGTPLKTQPPVKKDVLRTISKMLLENGHIRKRLDHLRLNRAESQRFDPEE